MAYPVHFDPQHQERYSRLLWFYSIAAMVVVFTRRDPPGPRPLDRPPSRRLNKRGQTPFIHGGGRLRSFATPSAG